MSETIRGHHIVLLHRCEYYSCLLHRLLFSRQIRGACFSLLAIDTVGPASPLRRPFNPACTSSHYGFHSSIFRVVQSIFEEGTIKPCYMTNCSLHRDIADQEKSPHSQTSIHLTPSQIASQFNETSFPISGLALHEKQKNTFYQDVSGIYICRGGGAHDEEGSVHGDSR